MPGSRSRPTAPEPRQSQRSPPPSNPSRKTRGTQGSSRSAPIAIPRLEGVSPKRIPRVEATACLTELLERICAGGKYLDCVTAVHAFGSWSRGAPEVGDVDLNVSYDARLDEEVDREVLDNLVTGRDWNTPFRKALKPRRRLHIMFNHLQMVSEPVLVYQRGDSIGAALARVRAIAEDPSAGRAEREPVHPMIESVADRLSRPSRILLTELADRGYIELAPIDLPDADLTDIANPQYRDVVLLNWPPTSPLARAATAAGVYLQKLGVDLAQVIVLERTRATSARVTRAPWAVEARESHLRFLVADLGQSCADQWLYVPRPARKRPLQALHIKPADAAALAAITDLDRWLADNAPQISRIG